MTDGVWLMTPAIHGIISKHVHAVKDACLITLPMSAATDNQLTFDL